MLVYANEIEIVGSNPALQVLRGISGWLSEKLGERITIRDSTSTGERSGGSPSAWLRTDKAITDNINLYSWVLKHPDPVVAGRQWVTELGLKDDGTGSAQFSCVVYTEEKSILVSDPVQASQPRVVKFIFQNVQEEPNVQFAPGSIGSYVKWVGNDVDSYRGLLADINNPSRNYPLILVSPDNEGNYPVQPERLQNILFGLAQVVGATENYNRYDMTETLGRENAAWAGAINIIRVPHSDGRIFTHRILRKDLPVELDTPHKKESFILGRVSHNTNIPRQRNRIRPEGVRTLSAKIRLEKRIAGLAEKPDNTLRDELGMVYEELSELTSNLDEAHTQREGLELTLLESEEKIQELEKQLKQSVYISNHRNEPSIELAEENEIADKLIHFTADPKGPNPEECLELIREIYPERVAVLPSAIESAREVRNFAQNRRLLDMLRRLVTDYLSAFTQGGDTAARSIFTNNEFAARESDTVTNNKQYLAYRRFDFDGREIEMLKHLKVGVADDPTSTIRVHFEIDQEATRVLIGHCGKHLPLPGR
ncbi:MULTISPECIES: hypothetical protein [unclassified Thioalkalivibrio]|uniref:hypothetical protein n=1 Tax=unclassified Thioalkalivibrio TaxID=2621013 RepID=UPI0003A85696|nr:MULTISPECIES: hypothetical protein [unclassified Thioalkalivibrio]